MSTIDDQWTEVRNVAELQLTQTDWLMNPPSDLPQNIADQIAAESDLWKDWRQALRDVPDAPSPEEVMWPWPPPTTPPNVAVSNPPTFVRLSLPVINTEGEVEHYGYCSEMTSQGQGYGGVQYGYEARSLIENLSAFQMEFKAVKGGIGGGSPRIAVGLDDQQVLIYLGDAPNFDTAPLGEWVKTGNLTLDEGKRIELSGSNTYITWADLVAQLGGKVIESVEVLVDGGWKFPDTGQQIMIRYVHIQ